MSNHTPAPWEASYDDNGFFVITATGMPSPYILATGGEGAVDECNAQLAAAAPEMLSIIEELSKSHWSDGAIWTDRINKAIQLLNKLNS